VPRIAYAPLLRSVIGHNAHNTENALEGPLLTCSAGSERELRRGSTHS
jgi:hypothetical protein